MKKTLSLLLVIVMLLLVSCGGDGSTTHSHYDSDYNRKCDVCGEAVSCTHKDIDKNNICDLCKTSLAVCVVHFDADGDRKCDSCGAAVTVACDEHTDKDGDDKCDDCGADITVSCTAHTDGDKNGVCDTCSISVIVILDFYAVNDTHGKFANSAEFTGVDELTTYLKNAYNTDDNAVILSSGDMWQGAAESNLTRGFIMTEWMNELDFASMTLGNHEFDWGSEYIEKNAELAEFPMLAINVYDKATNKRASYCEASVMIERGDVKIGIIGAIGDCYSSISASKVTDVYFKTGYELTMLVQDEADRLRAEGADFIVYSLHDGYGSSSSDVTNMTASNMKGYYDTVLSNGYVDLVFEGHTHQSYIHKDNKGVYHLQTSGDDSGVAHVELALNFVTDEYNVSVTDIVWRSEYQNLADDPIVENLLDKYADKLAIAEKLLGTNAAYRNSEYIKQKVAELYYQRGVEKWGSEYDIALGGGYINTRSPHDLQAGKVYYGDLINILPFDNDIVLCSISGAKLKSQFFESSSSNYYISYGTYGESIKNNIDATATYYVVVDLYSLDFAPNGLTYVDTLAPDTYARDVFADFIEAEWGSADTDTGTGDGTDDGTDNPTYTITPIKTILDKLDEIYASDGYNVVTEPYYVKGTIESIVSTKYGNCTIVDENGDRIYVYGINDGNGNIYQNIASKPQIGDTVILYGVAKYYKKDDATEPVKELYETTLIETIEE